MRAAECLEDVEQGTAVFAGALPAPSPQAAWRPTLAAAYKQILAAHQRPARKRLTVRLTQREIAGLTRAAGGRPLSVAMQDIVAAYLKSGRTPEPKERSVTKATFFLTSPLLQQLRQSANEAGTTPSEIVHAALCEAICAMAARADD